MIGGGSAAITLALLSVPLGLAANPVLYVAATLMFVVALIFSVRWMFGPGCDPSRKGRNPKLL